MLFFTGIWFCKAQVRLPTDREEQMTFGFVEMGADAEEMPLMDLMVLSG